MRIEKIVIKGTSGYGPVNKAYVDKLAITASSIEYLYKPHSDSNLETNSYKKWTYKTNSPRFEALYHQLEEMTPYYLYNDEILFVSDIGSVEITATFEDKHRESVNYYCPKEFFEEYFSVIAKMIPICEDIPALLSEM